jgi:hypothetical protein
MMTLIFNQTLLFSFYLWWSNMFKVLDFYGTSIQSNITLFILTCSSTFYTFAVAKHTRVDFFRTTNQSKTIIYYILYHFFRFTSFQGFNGYLTYIISYHVMANLSLASMTFNKTWVKTENQTYQFLVNAV